MPSRHPKQVSYDQFARELGLNLLRARQAKGWSQERVAHAAGLSAYTYHKFEKGESRPGAPMNPRLTTLLGLALVLEVSIEELLPTERPTDIPQAT